MLRIRLVLLVFLLAACATPAPAPPPTATRVPTETQPPTATPRPTETVQPATATVAPTNTPRPTPTPAPTEVTLPADYTFIFQGQPPEREAAYREATLKAYRWLLSQGIKDTGPFTLFLFADGNQGVQAAMEFFQMPEYWVKQRVNWYTDHAGTHGPGFVWSQTRRGTYLWAEKQGLTWDASEYVQAVLLNLAGLERNDVVNDFFPAWLIQGTELYFGARVCDYYEPGCFAGRYSALVTESRIHSSNLGSLASVEKYGGQIDSGVTGLYALDYLSRNYGGDQKIFDWHIAFRNRKPGQTWRDVFQEIYGITNQQLYDEFEAYRLVRYPNIYHAGSVSGAVEHGENGPEKGIWVFACPENPSYDCVPNFTIRYYHSLTDSYDPFWSFNIYVPMKLGDSLDIKVSFARSALPESIFGYYTENGGFTTDPAQATIIHLSNGQTVELGHLDLSSEYLPATLTPTPAATAIP